MKELLETIRESIAVPTELETKITAYFEEENLTSGTNLLREGEYCRKLYFLASGTVRTYYFHEDREVTSWFYKAGMFFTSWYPFYTGETGYECIDLMEDAVMYSISRNKYEELMAEVPTFERFGRILAENQVAFIDQFYKGYMFLSAKEKYQLLLEYFPDVELRVKLIYIASFLGISRETLSRIRGGNV